MDQKSYDAFTIDTNVLVRGGLQLDSGLLAQLNQFKGGPLQFVLSEVVARELLKRLFVQVKDAHENLQAALSKAAKSRVTASDQAGWDEKFANLPEPSSVAGARLKDFYDATDAFQVKASLAPMDGLVTNYFAGGAPFEPSGAKKHEFPDAIALLSLEAWAKKHGKRILAVSNDKGWKAFGDSSDYIDVVDELAPALAIVQEHSDAALAVISKWLSSVSADTTSATYSELTAMLHSSLSETPFYAEGSGHLCRDGQGEDLELASFNIDQFDGCFDLSVVRLRSNKIAVAVALTVVANASASFSMAAWDGIDKEDVSLGYQSAEREVEFDTVALLTFSLDAADSEFGIELVEVEVLDGPGTVDFGEIEFDFDDGDYDDWLAEQSDDSPKPVEISVDPNPAA